MTAITTYSDFRRSLRVLGEEKTDTARYKEHFAALWQHRGTFPQKWQSDFDRLQYDFKEQERGRNVRFE